MKTNKLSSIKIFNESCHAIEPDPKNSKYVAVDFTKNGTIVCRPTNDPNESCNINTLRKYMRWTD